MAWVRLDDGYPDHPKVDKAGSLAAWLNVCAWAYCARNLTDGFVPEERVTRLADVSRPAQLASVLLEVGLWERADAPCERCQAKREEVEAQPVSGNGYLVHDYLVYNDSRADVLRKRERANKRITDWREKRGSNSVGNAVSNAPGNGVTADVRNAPVTPPPRGESRARSTTHVQPIVNPPGGPPLVSKRVGETMAAIRQELALEPTLTSGDQAEVNQSNVEPCLIAEVYCAVHRGDYGDDFMRRRLSIGEAVSWVDGYRAWKLNPERGTGVSVLERNAPPQIDNTGKGIWR